MSDNYFSRLNAVNVQDKVEKKNGMNYLSWAWAWGEVKKLHPDATYRIYETPEGCIYHTDGKTCWVKTGVTVNGIEHIEYLPVMDMRNKSIPLDNVTSMDVNKTIQRSITKACARHGLGLYVYAGEDLPEDDNAAPTPEPPEPPAPPQKPRMATPEQIAYIRNTADQSTLDMVVKWYGEDMSKLSDKNAEELISRINNNNGRGIK